MSNIAGLQTIFQRIESITRTPHSLTSLQIAVAGVQDAWSRVARRGWSARKGHKTWVPRVFVWVTGPHKSIKSVWTDYLVNYPSLTEGLAWSKRKMRGGLERDGEWQPPSC